MTSKKRALALLLCLVMLLSLLPTAAFAAEMGEPVGDGVLDVPSNDESVGDDAPGAPTNDAPVGDAAPGVPTNDAPADPVILSAGEGSQEPAGDVESAAPAGGDAEQSEAEGALDPDAPNDDNPVILSASEESQNAATEENEENGDEILRSAQDDEDAPAPVRVVFDCDPAETVVTVYDPAQPDENGEPSIIDPEEDGSWLLLPGTYLYDAEAEGYAAVEKEPITVEYGASEESRIVVVVLCVPTTTKIETRTLATSQMDSVQAQMRGYATNATSTAEVLSRLNRWKSLFNGKYWNYYDRSQWDSRRSEVEQNLKAVVDNGILDLSNPTNAQLGVTTSPCAGDYYENGCRSNYFSGGWQCFGFAWFIEYALFQSTYQFNSSDWEVYSGSGLNSITLQPGDLVRYNNHSIVVGDVSGGSLNCIEAWGGSGCKISWSPGFNWDQYTTTASLLSACKSGGGIVYRYKMPSSNTYLSRCTYYPSYQTGETLSTYLKSLPCSESTDSSSINVVSAALPAGTPVTLTGLYKNTEGNYWYKAVITSGQYAGKEGYLYSAHVSSRRMSDVSYSGKAFPSTLYVGNSYAVDWVVKTDLLTINKINGYIYDANNTLKSYGSISNLNVKSYSLNYSEIDSNLKFNELPEGNYRCEIMVSAVNYYCTDGSTLHSATLQTSPIAFNFAEVPAGTTTYIVSYNANGGTNAPAAQIKIHNQDLILTSDQPIRASTSAGSFTVTLNANGGSVSPSQLTAVRTTNYSFRAWKNKASDSESGIYYVSGGTYSSNSDVTLYAQWNSSTTTASVSLPTPTRSGYTFQGWATSSTATSGMTGSLTPSSNVTLYAIWKQIAPTTYTVSYNANGGTGAPASQTKTQDVALTLSSTKPTRASASAGSYTVTLNANGGSVSTTSLTANRTTNYSFKNWNTAQNGGGTNYAPGASYTANAAVTLYAQWNSNTTTAAVTLPTPTRGGYTFQGWATSSTATSGTTGSYTPTGNVTLYATWKQNETPINPDAITITVSEARAALGESFVLNVSINNNSGFINASLQISYNSDALHLTEIDTSGCLLNGATTNAENGRISFASASQIQLNGVLFRLRFTVNENAEEGTYPVSVTVSTMRAEDGTRLSVQTVAGGVTVIAYEPGDVDGDGFVDSWDASLLLRYEAGLIAESTINLSAADVDGDGYADSWDASLILRFEAGLIEHFP